jgi:hypothetical protein
VTAVHLPPGPRWPAPIQGLAYIAARQRMMGILGKRAFAPKDGGRAVVYRRIATAAAEGRQSGARVSV